MTRDGQPWGLRTHSRPGIARRGGLISLIAQSFSAGKRRRGAYLSFLSQSAYFFATTRSARKMLAAGGAPRGHRLRPQSFHHTASARAVSKDQSPNLLRQVIPGLNLTFPAGPMAASAHG